MKTTTSGKPPAGFALIVTLSLMILLTIIAVGLLTLSTISLRSASRGTADATARANARLALMLALGDLQKAAGDDRRITADGALDDTAKHPAAVGVWKSWSAKQSQDPLAPVADYAGTKTSNFVSWLVSSDQPASLLSKDWAKTGTHGRPVALFSPKSDGFTHSGAKVDVMRGTSSSGTMAWAVVQNGTKAKINVAGPEDSSRVPNDDLQAQPRPNLASSGIFKEPSGEWNRRGNRVLSLSQVRLDDELWNGDASALGGAHFTTQGMGLLTDVVKGGLKTDLSLGFEMSDADFQQPLWGAFKNPFHSANASEFVTPASYQGERPLFRPLTATGSVRVAVNFNPASSVCEFPAAAVPTFSTLRSFYLTSRHLYQTADGPTVFERGMDHRALNQPSGGNLTPAATPPGVKSQTGYRPVLDRVIYLLSAGLGSDNEVRIVVTPIVTLWNPYNVALEMEGSVVYPWMDFPFRFEWRFFSGNNEVYFKSAAASQIISGQFINQGEGRSVNPYFFASITSDGGAIAGDSIRFKPGEVRTFAPSIPTDVDLDVTKSIRDRTILMRPVDNPNQLSTKGGIAIRTYNTKVPIKPEVDQAYGFKRPMAQTESVEISIIPDTGSDFPFGVCLEDATRAKLANPVDSNRGQAVSDIQTVNFSVSGTLAQVKSPRLSYFQLSNPASRQPFGMIETYHRVANDSALSRRSDLVFTTNPRQGFINRYLTTGKFVAAPHYETRLSPLSTFNGVLDTVNGGRSAFYGPTNSAGTGRSELSFFEIPQSPPLSLAAFQHADLSGTSYSPANQFGNSWASAYLKPRVTAEVVSAANGGVGQATYSRAEMPVYDYSYLINDALWDAYFFSGAASSMQPGTATGAPAVWNAPVANVTADYKATLERFIDDPSSNSLRNPRMRLHRGTTRPENLKIDLARPEGCLRIAGHLYVDGAFNVNSTSVEAWSAFLSGMRDRPFDVRNGSAPGAGNTAFSRFRNPVGNPNDHWMGFRALSDDQVKDLAVKMVEEVRKRGPFLSLSEFVNRRIESGPLGLKGAVQAAIDRTGMNSQALYDTFDTSGYPANAKLNINPANTGVGIPGYLTQADVLQSIAPVMTARSDSFTIRGYGEATDKSGNLLASSWCEAVVQRTPEFIDEINPPHTPVADLNPSNRTFGRRFAIISFRYLANSELGT